MAINLQIIGLLRDIGVPISESDEHLRPKSLDDVTKILARHGLNTSNVYPAGTDIKHEPGNLYISTREYLIKIQLLGTPNLDLVTTSGSGSSRSYSK